MIHPELTPQENFGAGELWQSLTDQFYLWEIRGRGWLVWNYPVEIEPPFRPVQYFIPGGDCQEDDAREPSWVVALIDKIKARFHRQEQSQPSNSYSPFDDEVAPEQFVAPSALCELVMTFPPEFVNSPETMANFLTSLSSCYFPLSLDVIGTSSQIVFVFGCRSIEVSVVRNQIATFFPSVSVTAHEHYLISLWKQNPASSTVIVDFGLSHEFMRPIQTVSSFDHDPLIGIVGAMSSLVPGEVSVIQYVFQPAECPWAEQMSLAVSDGQGGPFFSNAPEMLPLTKEKVSYPLFSVVVRVGTKAQNERRAWQLAQGLGATLRRFDRRGSNHLIPLDDEDYDIGVHENVFLGRLSHRSGMILNARELVSLAHFPNASVHCDRLVRSTQRTKQAFNHQAAGDVELGINMHRGVATNVSLAHHERLRHFFAIGGSGTGKSTLLLNMILQDMSAGRGLAVIDPHGDLIEAIIERMPRNRIGDTILFDPADADYPLGFNILSAKNDTEKTLLSSDLTAVFRRMATTWGDQMTSILSNAILAFLESSQGGTLIGLRRFLVDHRYRKRFLLSVEDPEVQFYWNNEFPLLPSKSQAPILTRLDTFLRPKLIRNIVAQKNGRLDLGTVVNGGKIFLAKLSLGAIGEENAYLLGSLLVSKFHQEAMARQGLDEATRKTFYLYLDEVHQFATPSLAGTLSGVRKYGLALTLALHELRQLSQVGNDLSGAIMTHPYTRVCFRVGDDDARRFASGFSYFEARDLQNLGIGEAICRIGSANNDFNLATHPMPERLPLGSAVRQQLVEAARRWYATPKEEVEAMLAKERGSSLFLSPDPEPQPEPKPNPDPTPEPNPVAQPSAPKESPPPEPPKPSRPVERPPLGRGGAEHVRLQAQVKKLGEARGFRSVIEQPLAGGGSVDISLEKGGQRIACEVSVTTGAGHEVENAKKCFNDGYDRVVLVSTSPKKRESLKSAIAQSLDGAELEKVDVLSIDDVAVYLDRLGAELASEEKTVRGYKVKVNYSTTSQKEQSKKKEKIAEVFRKAMNRLK